MRIVIFRLTPIGDTMITCPILRELREKYKNAHIAFAGNPAVLSLMQAWGLADEVWEADGNLLIELYSDEGLKDPKWLPLFSQADLAISLQRNRTDELLRNLLAAGAKEAILANEFRSEASSKHTMEVLAESIGIHHLSPEHIAAFSTNSNEFHFPNPPVAIHAGRGKADARCWPASSYATLITRLARLKQPVILIAGPADLEQLTDVSRRLPSSLPEGLVMIMKNAPLDKVAAVLEQCRCYLGTDSGMTHLAALTGVRTIAIFGPAYPLPPLGPRIELIKEPIRLVSVDRVLASIMVDHKSDRVTASRAKPVRRRL